MEVPNGFELTFKSFDIEAHSSCDYDWVEVSYGSYSQKFCGPNSNGEYYNGNGDNLGSSIPGPFTSTGLTMTVKMHTDGSVNWTGFRAVWGASNWAPGFPVSG